ncbi:carbohydrate-binding protein [Haloarcula marina]|uniref:carbohydrate-binding protein n=1 Tax=Haloarcula marina TaxID=2961574 RepID=UPI0020B8BD00|nr:carbohydrate-binding protein [Halomicroarcula marina]
MAKRQSDDPAAKDNHTNRRTFMKTVGVAAAAAVGSTAVGSTLAAENTVDLADEGLQNGDLIDPYLEDHFDDGNKVLIPAGEYDYTGDGLGGEKANCALIGSADGVVFNRPDPEETVRPSIQATDGTVRVANITVRGERGVEQSRWRVGAEEGATMEVFNVNVPDGTVDGSDSTGIYAGSDHAGTLHVKGCYFEGLGNVALYVSDPYTGEDGQVIVEDCVFRNSNSSMIRFAPSESIIRGCYFEATETAPSEEGYGGGDSLRAIKIDDAGDDVVIEDCDFYWGETGGVCVDFHERGEGGSGVVRDLRIYNENSDVFDTEWDVEGNWSGENIDISGPGSTDLPSGFSGATGGDAESPNTDYAIWTPVNGDGSTSTDGSGSTSSDGSTTDGSTDDSDTSTDSSDPSTVPLESSTTLLPRDGTVGGSANLESDWDGYSGDGFVNFPDSNGYVEWLVSADGETEYDLTLRYALGYGERTGAVIADGSSTPVTASATGAWTTWETVETTVTVPDGESTIRVAATGEDFGNLDAVQVEPAASTSEGSTSGDTADSGGDSTSDGTSGDDTSDSGEDSTTDTTGDSGGDSTETDAPSVNETTTLYPTDAMIGGDAELQTEHDGYSGDGFVNYPVDGGYVQWPVATTGGEYDVTIRYALGHGPSRTARIKAGNDVEEVTTESTESWTAWDTVSLTMTLPEGESSLRIESTGEDFGNLDRVEITPVSSGDGSTGGSTLPNRFEIDGTGDAEESAAYAVTVSGDITLDEQRTEVVDTNLAVDLQDDVIEDGTVTGQVRNGVDAYYYSGNLQSIDLEGDADINIFHG